MGLPVVLLLIIYALVVVIIFVFTVFNLYHVVRYALQTQVSMVITLVFVVGMMIVFGLSLYAILNIDWTQTINFNPLSGSL